MQENNHKSTPLSSTPNFIIYSPSYEETSGGTIVLHKLCDLINERGYSAKIWPHHYPPLMSSMMGCGFKYTLHKTFKNLIQLARGKRKKDFKLSRERHDGTVLAGIQDLRDSTIVIYPDIIYGNPLNAKNVVRWWLYKSSFHPRKKQAGVTELNFHYLESFLNQALINEGSYLLSPVVIMKNTYKQTNFGARRGCCHIIRKGRSKLLDQHPQDSILIDGLTHEETAKVFNEVEYCVCYDSYTLLSGYAVFCGCKVMVVPDEGVTLEEWLPDERARYGLAYGKENTAWAESTRHLVLEEWLTKEKQNIEMTKKLLEKCLSHFLPLIRGGVRNFV